MQSKLGEDESVYCIYISLDMDGTSIATATTDGIDALWLAHHGIIEII